jgi:hypothetical protein
MKSPISLIIVLNLVLHVVAVQPAQSANGCVGAEDAEERYLAEAPWDVVTRVDLKFSSRSGEYRAHWVFVFTSIGDMLVTVASRDGSTETKGRIMLVSGTAMVTEGLTLSEGAEIDALDMPVLTHRLLRRLLSEVIPDGPDGITGTRTVEKTEPDDCIYVGTPSAMGIFSPPWSVRGTVRRTGPEALEYDLSFQFGGGTETRSPTVEILSGTWTKESMAPRLPDDLSLDGWVVHRIGPITRKSQHETIYDFGAVPLATQFGSLGQLRSAISEGTFQDVH